MKDWFGFVAGGDRWRRSANDYANYSMQPACSDLCHASAPPPPYCSDTEQIYESIDDDVYLKPITEL